MITDDERTKLNGIATGAQVNKIESIKVNGTEVKPDSNKEVNITVDASGAAENAVSTHNTSSTAHSDIRTLVSNAQTTADNAQTKANKIEELIVKNGVIDGSPKGVYANLSALQTAYPSGSSGVYLTSDNGHWYWWNGSAWSDGGVYQANSNIDLLKNKVELVFGEELPKDVEYSNDKVGYVRWSDSIFETYEYFRTTDPIELKKDETIYVNGFKKTNSFNNVAIISVCDKDGTTYSKKVRGVVGKTENYSYTATDNCYVAICMMKNENLKIFTSTLKPVFQSINRLDDDSDYLFNDVLKINKGYVTDFTVKSGYVRINNVYDAWQGYNTTSPIKVVSGDVVSVKLKNSSDSAISGVSIISLTNENETYYVSKVSGIKDQNNYELQIENDGYIVVSFQGQGLSNAPQIYKEGCKGLYEAKKSGFSNTYTISGVESNITLESKNKCYIKATFCLKENCNCSSDETEIASILGNSLKVISSTTNGQITGVESMDSSNTQRKYPIVNLESGFKISSDSWIPTELEKQIVGEILFGFRYNGTITTGDSAIISFDGSTFNMKLNGNDYINIDCTQMTYCYELYDALVNEKENGKAIDVVNNYPKLLSLDNVLKFSNVQLFEQYTDSFSTYFFWFRNAICDKNWFLEIYRNETKLLVLIDGKVLSNNLVAFDEEIILKKSSFVEFSNIEINNGSLGNAEIVNGKFISEYSPYVVLTTNHAIASSREYDTTNSLKNAILNGTEKMTMSGNTYQPISVAFLRKFIEKAKRQGYSIISLNQYADWITGKIEKLPKKCLVLIFDDQEIEVFADVDIRKVFEQNGAVGNMAIELGQKDSLFNNNFLLLNARLCGYGVVSHMDGTLKTNSQITNRKNEIDTINKGNYFIDTSINVYTGTATNPSSREVQEYTGFKIDIQVGTQYERFVNPHRIGRNWSNQDGHDLNINDILKY